MEDGKKPQANRINPLYNHKIIYRSRFGSQFHLGNVVSLDERNGCLPWVALFTVRSQPTAIRRQSTMQIANNRNNGTNIEYIGIRARARVRQQNFFFFLFLHLTSMSFHSNPIPFIDKQNRYIL